MPTRIEIELTSSSPDGSWTWRAAGAREPRGVLDGSILPGGVAVGDQLRVETEHDVDGIRVLSVVPAKEKARRSDLLELLPTEESFDPVVQQRAPGGRTDDRPRRPRRERPDRGDSDRGNGRRPDRRADGRDRSERGDRDRRDRVDRDRGQRGERSERGDDDRRREPRRPHFTPPPELPQRPKPKRLRPGKQHRSDVLTSLPEEQRPIAELALQGLGAVRQRLREDNARLKAEGKPEMPEAAVMKMAEELIPRLRVADWLDRADAARRQLEHLDLRDLRSVVASADDPVVARDESTRALAAELKSALATKQEEELTLWLADVEAALDVGRVVRALRLSSVPPKAGVPFPGALAVRLGEATTAALQPTDGPDRWSAVLEAAAFSPVRTLVAPTAPAEQRNDELLATVRRLAPLLPQVAALYGIEAPAGAPAPKPLRPTSRRREPSRRPTPEGPRKERTERPPRPPRPPGEETPAVAEAAPVEEVASSAESVPVEAAAPTEEAAPVEEVAPVEASAPAEPAAPTEEAAPAEEAAPVEKVAPAEPAAPTEEAAPTEDAAPMEPAPNEEPEPAGEATPVEDAAPSVEAAQAVEEAAPIVESPPAVEEAEPVEESAHATEDAPAEEAAQAQTEEPARPAENRPTGDPPSSG
jgi:hypothetical protein